MNQLLTQFPQLSTKDGQDAARLLFKILDNIIKHPKDKKYHDLNATKIGKKFEKCTICLDLLTIVGFTKNTVNEQERLIWNESDLSTIKGIHAGINKFLSQLEESEQNTADNYANNIIIGVVKPLIALSHKDRSEILQIIQSVMQNPENKIYQNLHLYSLCDKLENADSCISILRGLGFHKTVRNNQQRLIMQDINKKFYIETVMKLVFDKVDGMMDELEMKQNPKIQFVGSCDGKTDCCPSIERMIKYMKDYDDIKEYQLVDVGKLFNREQTPFLHDDFNHILIKHLGDDQENKITNKQFEDIYNYMIKQVKLCEFGKCSKFGRNQRDSEKQNIFLDDNTNTNNIDKQIIYYIEYMDMIHCFFMHSFDCGFRLRMNEISHQKSWINVDALHIDERMIALNNALEQRRQKLQNVRGSERFKKSKFVTNIGNDNNTAFSNDDSKDSNDEKKDDAQNDGNKDNENDKNDEERVSGQYSFGNFYQYWSKDLDNIQKSGLKFGHYVEAKYSNLKEEILNNCIHTIDVETLDNIILKAKIKMRESDFAKTLIANGDGKDDKNGFENNLYRISVGSSISYKHIVAVLLYTDLDTLSYHFSTTWRSMDGKYDINICKKRNGEYANWSKLLCEAVNIFGQKVEHNFVYYHGLSKLLYFPSFLTIFNSPTSTSAQLSVAAMFAANSGVIVELEEEGGVLRNFDCRWLSRFANEDERLFICPPLEFDNYRLRFTNIRDVAVNESYKYYVYALTHLAFIVAGDCSPSHCVSDRDLMIITKLFNHHDHLKNDKNNFPKYINDLFHVFIKDQSEININYHYFGDETQTHVYTKFKPFFCHKNSNSIRINYICRIFDHCKVIKTMKKWNAVSRTGQIDLNTNYFETILSEIDLLNNNNNTLKCIELRDVEFNSVQITHEIKPKFNQKGWNIDDKREEDGTQYLVITKI